MSLLGTVSLLFEEVTFPSAVSLQWLLAIFCFVSLSRLMCCFSSGAVCSHLLLLSKKSFSINIVVLQLDFLFFDCVSSSNFGWNNVESTQAAMFAFRTEKDWAQRTCHKVYARKPLTNSSLPISEEKCITTFSFLQKEKTSLKCTYLNWFWHRQPKLS